MTSQNIVFGFIPNFSSVYSVELNCPIAEVFQALNEHERVCRLSSLCSHYELLELDSISLPESTPLSQVSARRYPKAQPSHDTADAVIPSRTLPRQAFKLTETVPIFFIKKDVNLLGTVTMDEAAKVALYESQSDGGIQVWKLREFEDIAGTKTKLTETIQGRCPVFLRPVVQFQTTKGHQYV